MKLNPKPINKYFWKIPKYLKLNNPKVKEEIAGEMRKYFENI